MAAVTVVFDSPATPKVTLTLDGALYTAVLEVEDFSPDRLPSAEEQALGITSLDPPTVQAYDLRALIDGSQRAVQAAASSTTGERGGPFGIAMTYLRTAIGVRAALRQLQSSLI